MQLRIHDRVLVTSDAQRIRVFDIGDDRSLSLRAERVEPTALNAFTEDPAGERLSRVVEGRFARSITAPGQSGHWSDHDSTVIVYDLDLNELHRFTTPRLDDRSLALSPDATRVTSVNRGAGVVVHDVATGARLAEHDGSIGSGVAWSPDGRWIAAGDTAQGPGELYLLDATVDPVDARRSLPAPSSRAPLFDSPYNSAFSSDGARVVFSCSAWGRDGITVYDVETGAEQWARAFARQLAGDENEEPEEEFWHCLEVDFAHGASVVTAGILGERLQAWRADDGDELTALACPGADGRFYAVDERRRCVWYSRDGEPTAVAWPDDWAV